ncbi:MAG: hypothetical protein QOC77_3827, partial [Thermoleophilaceae bacterium]|nr:hypothetical protein [Thermoleophilaceae bacterium]
MRRFRQVAGLLLAVAAASIAAVLLLSGGSSGVKRTASTCPAGQRLVADNGESDAGAGGDYESHFRGRC